MGYVQVQLGPPAALAAGGAWRTLGSVAAFSSTPGLTVAVTSNGGFALEFKDIAGWNLPPDQTVSVTLGQTTIIKPNYTVLPPQMKFNPTQGLGITGTTGTTYRIEYRTNLSTGTWLPLKTNTLISGLNQIVPWPPTNGPAAFYRAIWLQQ